MVAYHGASVLVQLEQLHYASHLHGHAHRRRWHATCDMSIILMLGCRQGVGTLILHTSAEESKGGGVVCIYTNIPNTQLPPTFTGSIISIFKYRHQLINEERMAGHMSKSYVQVLYPALRLSLHLGKNFRRFWQPLLPSQNTSLTNFCP